MHTHYKARHSLMLRLLRVLRLLRLHLQLACKMPTRFKKKANSPPNNMQSMCKACKSNNQKMRITSVLKKSNFSRRVFMLVCCFFPQALKFLRQVSFVPSTDLHCFHCFQLGAAPCAWEPLEAPAVPPAPSPAPRSVKSTAVSRR